MKVGENQPLLLSPPLQTNTATSGAVVRSPKRTLWKAMMLCGTGMTILATLFALYTATVSFSSSSPITEQERSLLNHYYGPYMMMTLMESSSSVTHQIVQQLRNAQQTADTTIQELNTPDAAAAADDDLDDTHKQERDDEITDQNPPDTETEDTASDENHPQVRGLHHRSLVQHPRKLRPHHHEHHHEDKRKKRDENNIDEPLVPPIGCETTVVLIRHCEKELIAEHCAYNGYERSVYLSTLFGDSDTAKYPKPTLIFAESPISRNAYSHKMNFREVETVGPLAEVWNVPIDDSYTDETIYELGRHLKDHIKRGDFCGQVIVVVWKHTRIAEFAHRLGCGPIQGCPIDYSGKTFDQLWQIRYVYTNEFTHSTHKHHFLHHPADHVYWKVFGSMQYENFDPLAFSKLRGDDYDSSSTPLTTNWNDPSDTTQLPMYALSKHQNDIDNHNHKAWQEDVVSYPERSYSTDTAGWKVTMLGLSKSTTDPVTTVP